MFEMLIPVALMTWMVVVTVMVLSTDTGALGRSFLTGADKTNPNNIVWRRAPNGAPTRREERPMTHDTFNNPAPMDAAGTLVSIPLVGSFLLGAAWYIELEWTALTFIAGCTLLLSIIGLVAVQRKKQRAIRSASRQVMR